MFDRCVPGKTLMLKKIQSLSFHFTGKNKMMYFTTHGRYSAPLILFRFLMSLLIEGSAVMCVKP